MKLIICLIFAAFTCVFSGCAYDIAYTRSDGYSYAVRDEVKVRGYYRKDGGYVESHYRTRANETRTDNWSTKGNVNPYTGKRGRK